MDNILTGVDFYLAGETDPIIIRRIREREAFVSGVLSPAEMKSREEMARSAQKKKIQLKLF